MAEKLVRFMKGWPYKTPGIPDESFIRGEVPMTKEEIRSVTLAKARLTENNIIYDIGAGTGSISVEAALMSPAGLVLAIEKNPAGIELIKKNADAFGAANIKIISGEAPDILAGLPEPDRVIIGGSGGNMTAIIAAVDSKLKANGRIVANFIVLENLYQAIKEFEERGYQVDITQLAVSKGKKIGEFHMLQSQNPIYIVAAERRQA